MVQYFKLYDDVYVPGRWHVGNPVDAMGQAVNPWQFGQGTPVDLQGELVFPLQEPGHPLDFSEAGFAIPLLSQRAMELLLPLVWEAAQFFPVRVESREEPFHVMNVTRLVDCIDEARCHRTEKWKPEDGRPERLGDYRLVEQLRIDPGRVEGARVLRPRGWPVLVVDESIQQAMERAGLTGPRFSEV